MAYVISDDCIACGACADECPTSAIKEGDGKYVIVKDECMRTLPQMSRSFNKKVK